MFNSFSIQNFIAFLFAAGCSFAGCTSENEPGKSLSYENALLRQKIDSLTQQIDSLQKESDTNREVLGDLDVRFLKRQGLQNPVIELKVDLVKNKQLIPEKGTLGGTMQFYEDNIHILSRKWVRAYFEDGHTAGEMLLAYKVNKSGEIEWQVLDTAIK
jgi:hypothetical protein